MGRNKGGSGRVGDEEGGGGFVPPPPWTSPRLLSEEQEKDSNQNPSCRRVVTNVS